MAETETESRAEIENLNFEQALKELEEIVRKLEAGQAPLDQAMQLYERGTALKKHCESLLNAAKMKMETMQFDQPVAEQGEDAPSA